MNNTLPEELFCKCKNGKPCSDTLHAISKALSQSYKAGERAERKRILEIINDPKRFTWIDIEGMSLIKEITKFLSPKENE